MKKIEIGDILIFNSTRPHNTLKRGDRVIFRGLMYLPGAKKTYLAVDFGPFKNMICDMGLFIALEELREKNIDTVLEI